MPHTPGLQGGGGGGSPSPTDWKQEYDRVAAELEKMTDDNEETSKALMRKEAEFQALQIQLDQQLNRQNVIRQWLHDPNQQSANSSMYSILSARLAIETVQRQFGRSPLFQNPNTRAADWGEIINGVSALSFLLRLFLQGLFQQQFPNRLMTDNDYIQIMQNVYQLTSHRIHHFNPPYGVLIQTADFDLEHRSFLHAICNFLGWPFTAL